MKKNKDGYFDHAYEINCELCGKLIGYETSCGDLNVTRFVF